MTRDERNSSPKKEAREQRLAPLLRTNTFRHQVDAPHVHSGMAANGDPFPGFEKVNLDFAVDAAALALLPTYLLALAPFSTRFPDDDDQAAALEKRIVKLFRQRREKHRARIGGQVGVFATDQGDAQFPLFECSDLSWKLDESTLKNLTSAQLVVSFFFGSSSNPSLRAPLSEYPVSTGDLVPSRLHEVFNRCSERREQ